MCTARNYKTKWNKELTIVNLFLGTFPIDTTKTRLQIQGQKIDPRHVELRYTGMVDCIIKTSKQEGVKALYCG